MLHKGETKLQDGGHGQSDLMLALSVIAKARLQGLNEGCHLHNFNFGTQRISTKSTSTLKIVQNELWKLPACSSDISERQCQNQKYSWAKAGVTSV